MQQNIKIALVLYTHGLEYDDRIRKEILSIQKISNNVKFKIFAITPQNIEEKGITSYGIPYRKPYLVSRDKFKSGGHLLEKAYDFYKSVKNDLNEFDIVWCADTEPILFLLFSAKPLIWDLHELPTAFMNCFLGKKLLRYIEKKCLFIIHANSERLNHLLSIKAFLNSSKHFVLRNYPLFNQSDSDIDEVFKKFKGWKKQSNCVYLQGLTDVDRADIESVEAVLSQSDLKCVVVGTFKNESKNYLLKKYSKQIEERVFFTGMINQLKTSLYIKECFTSLIFYKDTCLNNFFCEPNRMFQNIINGNPIVVGVNPPMKEFVNKYKCGVSVNTDGSNVNEIIKGLKEIRYNYDFYKTNTLNASDKILWSNQNTILKELCDIINNIKQKS